MITLTLRGECRAWSRPAGDRVASGWHVYYDADTVLCLGGERMAALHHKLNEWIGAAPAAVRTHRAVPFVLTVGLDEARWSLTFGEGLPKCPTCGEVARAGDTWCSEACEPRCELCGAVADHATPSDCAEHAAMAADIDMKETA